MEEPDSETPTPVIEKISTDLNRIANVLEAGRHFFKEFGKEIGRTLTYLWLTLCVLGLVTGAKIIILRRGDVSEGTHCVVAQEDVYGVAEPKVRTELAKALKLKDEIGLQNLIASGKALPLPKDTECLVLDTTDPHQDEFGYLIEFWDLSYYYKVRVLSGAYYGKVVWIPHSVLHIAARTDAVGNATGTEAVGREATLGEMLDAFVDAKRYFSGLHPDYSLMEPYQPGTVTKLGEGQYRVLLKYDSKPIQCEVNQSVATCSK
jgi:hypothetical protein